jgi:hypothetical protein
MKMLLVRVNGLDGAVVGYAPGPCGPQAIVVLGDEFRAVSLDQLELVKLPKGLKKSKEKIDFIDEEVE